jgi:ketosteroid isomerase-like protein
VLAKSSRAFGICGWLGKEAKVSWKNVEILRRGYEAYRWGDIQAVSELFDPEIEIYQSERLPWSGLHKGPEEVGPFFAKLTETIESEVDPDQYVDDEEGHVVVFGRSRGKVRAIGRS